MSTPAPAKVAAISRVLMAKMASETEEAAISGLRGGAAAGLLGIPLGLRHLSKRNPLAYLAGPALGAGIGATTAASTSYVNQHGVPSVGELAEVLEGWLRARAEAEAEELDPEALSALSKESAAAMYQGFTKRASELASSPT